MLYTQSSRPVGGNKKNGFIFSMIERVGKDFDKFAAYTRVETSFVEK